MTRATSLNLVRPDDQGPEDRARPPLPDDVERLRIAVAERGERLGHALSLPLVSRLRKE